VYSLHRPLHQNAPSCPEIVRRVIPAASGRSKIPKNQNDSLMARELL
jgi:hypothetical protein